MNTAQKISRVKAAITRFDAACREYAFRGSFEPEAAEAAEDEYTAAHTALVELISRY